VLGADELPFLHCFIVAGQLRIRVEHWAEYGGRAQTRREHLVELQIVFDFEPFTSVHHRLGVQELIETAMQTDKGIVLAMRLVEMLRERRIVLPRLNAIECVCAEAITRANRRIYKGFRQPVSVARGVKKWFLIYINTRRLPGTDFGLLTRQRSREINLEHRAK